MYEFIDRLINIALPRVRDFRGLNGKSFDGNGNYSLGLKEQIETFINISNISLIDPNDNKASRVKYKIEGKKKLRVSSRSGKEI